MRSKTKTIPALMAILMILAGAISAGMMPALAQDGPEMKRAPTGLAATPSPEGIILTWDDPGDDTVTRYRIERQSFTSGKLSSQRSVTVRPGPMQTHTGSPVEAGRTHSHQIWALSDTGKSEGSDIVTIKAPETPSEKREAATTRQPQSDKGVRQDSPPTLHSLSFSHGTLTPSFSPLTTSYTLNITTNATTITVYYSYYNEQSELQDRQSTITLNTTGNTTRVDLKVDRGTSRTYTIRIHRTRPPPRPSNRSPNFPSSSYTRTVAENTSPGEDIGSTITASDPDGSIASYSLEDTDASHFTVTNDGQLQTSGALNFEVKNNYQFTIKARDNRGATATAEVTVAVEDLQEAGSVTIAPATGIIHEELTATLHDDDERTSENWQWSRSDDGETDWTYISRATASTYTPTEADPGKYLRTTVSYDDIDPGQSAEASIGPIRDPTLRSLTVSPRDIDSFHPARFEYAVGVENTVTQATVTATASNPSATITYGSADIGAGAGHQVDLNSGVNLVSIEVSDNTISRTYSITIGQGVTAEYGWKAQDDLDTLIGAGNLSPRGLWSDETTVWVADDTTDKLFAYTLQTGAREKSKDIELDADNRNPRGAWSDGAIIWVADAAQAKLFGYPLQDAGAQEFGLHGNNADPWGIWSNGETLWVADRTEGKLFAYNLQTQARVQEQDINLDGANQDPTGIWADGLTIWVADDQDDQLYAYRISDGAPEQEKNFNTLTAAGNTSPQGLWSDGDTLWAADTGESKIYAYNLPISSNADLRSITIDGHTIRAPRTNVKHYIEEAPTYVTISAQPQHPRAEVAITPPDADDQEEGHQLELGDDGVTFTIAVTAKKGDPKIYSVQVIVPAGKPEITEVVPGNRTLQVSWEHPENTGGAETDEIFYYNIRYIRSDATDKSDNQWIKKYYVWLVNGGDLTYLLEDLDNGVQYDLQLQGWTRAGDSDWSETHTGTPSITKPPAFDHVETAGHSVAENAPGDTNVGKPVTATDPDPGDTLTYSLERSNANFSIVAATGQIRTKEGHRLDYESKPSHTITVSVTDGINAAGDTDLTPDATISVTINVENVDEPGKIQLPQEGLSPRDTVSITVLDPQDPDRSVQDVTWQWASSIDRNTQFNDIPGATQASYTPTTGLVGSYLRVTATYTDGHGPDKTASAISDYEVGDAPNEAPVFPNSAITLSVDENTPARTPRRRSDHGHRPRRGRHADLFPEGQGC